MRNRPAFFSHLFSKQLPLTPRRSRKRIDSDSISYSKLEPKNLLATFAFDMGTGIITIDGDATDENVSVVLTTPGGIDTVEVRQSGIAIGAAARADVTSLLFNGNDGDDTFVNDTDVPGTINGGGGVDTLSGGTGNDIINGNVGNDQLFGRGGNDEINGGNDDDFISTGGGDNTVTGGDGNDTIVGGSGVDTISGDAGNDSIFAGGGNDLINGGDGDDNLDGGEGNDEINGDGGDDRLAGRFGNDRLDGGEGNDRLLGNNGNDTIRGGIGDDSANGGADDDFIAGGDGDDVLAGDNGVDTIFGQQGSDLIFGGDGNDFILGNQGKDFIYGQAGDDIAFGGGDIDILNGNEGDDELHGQAGNDRLFGAAGNDSLYGQTGIDRLFGFTGNDGLFGGVAPGDLISGGEGNDRFLRINDDTFFDVASEDVIVEFRSASANWNNVEIAAIDQGMKLLHDRTGSTSILKDPLTSAPLLFIKENTIPAVASIASNALVDVTRFDRNPTTGQVVETTFKQRQLRFPDWNEADVDANLDRSLEVPRVLALSWASREAVSAVFPDRATYWNQFLTLSDWRTERPTFNSTFYTVSGDNQWFYLKSAKLADATSSINPQEDFASVWELYFTPDSQMEQDRMVVKINKVDELFTELAAV